MQLNISSDYAIRAMLFLAIHPNIATAPEISRAMNITLNTCRRNLQLLKNAGLVTPYPGANGGYTLAKRTSEICIGDILQAVGEKMELNRCLEEDRFCNRNATADCAVRAVYEVAQAALHQAFATTLEQLVQCPKTNCAGIAVAPELPAN